MARMARMARLSSSASASWFSARRWSLVPLVLLVLLLARSAEKALASGGSGFTTAGAHSRSYSASGFGSGSGSGIDPDATVGGATNVSKTNSTHKLHHATSFTNETLPPLKTSTGTPMPTLFSSSEEAMLLDMSNDDDSSLSPQAKQADKNLVECLNDQMAAAVDKNDQKNGCKCLEFAKKVADLEPKTKSNYNQLVKFCSSGSMLATATAGSWLLAVLGFVAAVFAL